MNGSLVDTNIIIKLLNGDSKTSLLFDSLEQVFISVITAGELYYGAYKSSKVNDNIQLFNDFLSEYKILAIDKKISGFYGIIKEKLVNKGINIPENDIWIAATALSNKLPIVTYDEHFNKIDDLTVINRAI